MNILFICDEYPPGKNGGIGTMVQVLGRELVKQGHKVIVVGLYPYFYGQKDFEIDNGVEVYRLRYGINFGRETKNFFYKAYGKMPDFIRRNLNGKSAFNRFIKKINELVDKENIDVIEIPDWHSFVFDIGFEVKWPKFKVPLILKSHGSYTYFSTETNEKGIEQYLKLDQELYNRADALTAVSKYTESINRKLFGYTKDVEILYNGIEITPLNNETYSKEEKTVIFTGTLVKKKGIYSLLKAWNKVNELQPDAKLKIYGKGENIQELKGLLSAKSSKSVFFMGHTNRPNLFKELSTATCAIFPSYSETFGLAPVEAMSVGCPTIFTKRSCGPEIIRENIDGLLVDPDNIEEIAETILKLIHDKDLQLRLSENGTLNAKNRFNIENIAKEHELFYTKIISDLKL